MSEVIFTTTYKPCSHDNGWYGNIKILGYKIRLFFCEDCHRFIKLHDLYKQRSKQRIAFK